MPRTEKNCPLCAALEPANDENGMMLANVAAGDAGLAGSESLRMMDILGGYFFPKTGISVSFKILYVRIGSTMNASQLSCTVNPGEPVNALITYVARGRRNAVQWRQECVGKAPQVPKNLVRDHFQFGSLATP
jgi:hypothetical protein